MEGQERKKGAEKSGAFRRVGGGRRYRAGKYLPRPRIELRAPACGRACIQNRPGDDKRPGGVVSFNPGIPSFDGPARSQKPSLVTSTLVPKLTPRAPLPAASLSAALRPLPSRPPSTVVPSRPENYLAAGGRGKPPASHGRR